LTLGKNGKDGGDTGLLNGADYADVASQFKNGLADESGVFLQVSKKIGLANVTVSHYSIDKIKDSDLEVSYALGKNLTLFGAYTLGNNNSNVDFSEVELDLKYTF